MRGGRCDLLVVMGARARQGTSDASVPDCSPIRSNGQRQIGHERQSTCYSATKQIYRRQTCIPHESTHPSIWGVLFRPWNTSVHR